MEMGIEAFVQRPVLLHTMLLEHLQSNSISIILLMKEAYFLQGNSIAVLCIGCIGACDENCSGL